MSPFSAISVKTFNANLVSLPKDVLKILHRTSSYDEINDVISNATSVEEITKALNSMSERLKKLKTKEDVDKFYPRAKK